MASKVRCPGAPMKARTWYLRLAPKENTGDTQMTIDVMSLMLHCEIAFGRHIDHMLLPESNVIEDVRAPVKERSKKHGK